MTDTVLAHLAASIAQKENLATEALAFILNRSAPAREALRQRLAAAVGEVPTLGRILTQQAVSDEGRPDVVLYNQAGQKVGFIEAKFWAALTPAQPVDYLQQLPKAGSGVLLLLAPERRLPSLRADVLDRCTAAKLPLVDRGPMAFDVGPNRLALMSWSSLLASMRDAVAEDRATTSDVAQLTGLCARCEAEGFIPLTREDLDDLRVPRLVLQFANLVNAIVDTGVAAGVVSVKGLKATHFQHATGRYVEFARAGAWLGLNHTHWSRRGRSPLWIRFSQDDWGRADALRTLLRPWMSMDPPRAWGDDEDGAVRVPLRLRTGVEQDAVVADVLEQLRELDGLMSSAGMPLLKGAAPPVG
ncbi:MAG: hypothetical protein EPO40_17540 [Myxococcaceae bacterium]|nr:MAG: hypothetical protein EPO40_17540 [Myxococcaceae bacterium]